MMAFHLSDQASFGEVGTSLVLLDLRADRYWRLRGTDAAMLGALSDTGADCPAGTLHSLLDRGILRPGPGAAIEPVTAPQPLSSALEQYGRETRIRAAEIALFRIEAAARLRFWSLSEAVDRWRSRRSALAGRRRAHGASIGCDTDEAAEALARGYASARLQVPLQRLCVPDSFALLRCLWRRGVSADLYFGVRLDPFAAHAWVQRGDRILSDPLGLVADYRPVFRL